MNVQPRLPRYRRGKARPFQFQERDYQLVRAVGLLKVAQSTHFERLFPKASADNLRRRLYFLFHHGYLARPRAQAGELVYHEGSSQMVYTLAPRGARLLEEREGLRVFPKAADSELVHLKHALLVTDFMVAAQEACRQSDHLRLITFRQLLEDAPAATQTARRPSVWRVDVEHKGRRRGISLEPDSIFAVAHAQLAAPRNRKFFFLEIDRGTMPVVRPGLEQTSILRKLLTYVATFKARIHHSRFAMDNMRVLLVGKSRERVDGMLRALQEKLPGDVPRGLFLFVDRRTLFNGDRLFDVRWRSGTGEEVTLLPSRPSSSS